MILVLFLSVILTFAFPFYFSMLLFSQRGHDCLILIFMFGMCLSDILSN